MNIIHRFIRWRLIRTGKRAIRMMATKQLWQSGNINLPSTHKLDTYALEREVERAQDKFWYWCIQWKVRGYEYIETRDPRFKHAAMGIGGDAALKLGLMTRLPIPIRTHSQLLDVVSDFYNRA